MSFVEHTPEETANKDIQRTASDFVLFDLHTLAHFQDERPFVHVLSEREGVRLVLFAFKVGQHLKEHHTSSQILIQVLRGHITCTIAQRDMTLQAGMVLQVEENVFHSIVAQTDAVMLLTMILVPAQTRSASEHHVSKQSTPLVTRSPHASEQKKP